MKKTNYDSDYNMTEPTNTVEELLEKYKSLRLEHKRIVSKYIRMVYEIQEYGIVLKEDSEPERAIRRHCAIFPHCALFKECNATITGEDGVKDPARRLCTKPLQCSFCGSSTESPGVFFAGNNGVLICDSCVRLCMKAIWGKKKQMKPRKRLRSSNQRYRRRKRGRNKG